jgi:tRNA U38,U39,U40 pseudouridine synthase TruA
MYKYKITLEYDGTSYRGWQTQKNARSVQDTLINAAEKLLKFREQAARMPEYMLSARLPTWVRQRQCLLERSWKV